MKQKSGMIGVVYAAILSAIAGYFFRMTQLSGGSSVPLIAFSILMVFVFALAAVSLEKKSAYEAVYRPSGQDLTFSLLGALGLIAGCVLSFRGSIAQMLVSLLGLLAGLSLGAGAVLRWKEKKPSAAFSVFVVLFYVAKLFRDFRHWEINPAILDYCFSLFAMIAFMLASYHAGAFSFERGARRRLAFYSLLGVLFGAMSYTIIDKIIASLQVDALINDTIKGSILLVAVIIQLVVPMIRSRVKTKHTSEV